MYQKDETTNIRDAEEEIQKPGGAGQVLKGLGKIVWTLVKCYFRICAKVGLAFGLSSTGDKLGADHAGAHGGSEIRRSFREVKSVVKEVVSGKENGEMQQIKRDFEAEKQAINEEFDLDNPDFQEKYHYYYENKK